MEALEPADAATVQHRFAAVASETLGGAAAGRLREALGTLASSADVGAVLRLAEPRIGAAA